MGYDVGSLPILRLRGGSLSKDKTSAIGGCQVLQRLHSLLRKSSSTMPASRLSVRSSSTGGSFVERESSFNRHRFTTARDDATRPYPSAHDVYRRSNTHNPHDDEFADLGLSDFFVAHRRIARRRLERLNSPQTRQDSFQGESKFPWRGENLIMRFWRRRWATLDHVR